MIASQVLLIPLLLLSTQADPETAVETGRAALDNWWWTSYPWYDAAKDDLRPIDVSEPWYVRLFKGWDFDAPNWRWNLGSWLPANIGEWIAWTVLLVCLAAVTYFMLRILRARRRGLAGAAARESAAETLAEQHRRIEALPSPVRRRVVDLLGEARRHYDAGNYGEAIVYLFSHQLVELDKHHLIRLDKGKTNRQYVRELGPRNALQRLLGHSMHVFEDAFFGNRAIDRRRFETCWLRLDEFNALLAEGGV
jgi:hypothetical protein